ncbi:MAG: hypothetical protein EBZ47_06255 [Chlamydiae bacterium]|nr:hypothetical protein [Chlamydiota bacterium]
MYFFWQTQINGFFVREKSPIDKDGNRMLVLGCRYLAPNGKCSNYFTRPSVCRKWPIVEHFGHPRILKGCGYQINLKKSYKKEPYLSHFKKIKQETADKT